MTETKICTKCGVPKELNQYNKHGQLKSGLRPECKDCQRKRMIRYAPRAKEIKALHYINNKSAIDKKNREYYQRTSESQKDYQKKYRSENKESLKQYRSKRKPIRQARRKFKLKTNPLYKLKYSLRRRISEAFKSKSWIKHGRTETLIGCDFQTAKHHLESKFTEGMNWSNYGDWHIDHIMPISSAKTESEMIKLFNYTNLQPLWAIDNIKKSNKLLPL